MHLPVYAKYVLVLLGIVLIFVLLYVGSNFFIPFFLGLLFSLLVLPVSKWLEIKGVRRGLAAVICIFAMVIGLGSIIYFITIQIQSIAGEAGQIQEELASFLDEVQDFLESDLGIERETQREYWEDFQGRGSGFFNNIIDFFPPLVTASVLIPLSMFFMLKHRGFYEEFVYKLYDPSKHERIKKGIKEEKSIVIKYLLGILSVVMIMAVCNTIALVLFGLEHAVFFAVVAAFLNIIPILGTLLGSTLPVIYALIMKDSLFYPFGIALYFTFIQLIESYIFIPQIVGNRVQLNPYVIILAIFIGNEVWGATGMILFIPLVAILKVICKVVPELNAYHFLLSDPEAGEGAFISKVFDKLKAMFKRR